MYTHIAGRAILFAATLALASCGGSETDATSITFVSSLITDGQLPIPRNPEGGTPVGIVANGAIDLDSLECKSSDDTVLGVIPLGELVIVTALADRFDSPPVPDAGMEDDAGMPSEPYGTEPEAIITCTVGDLTASVTALGVVDATGLWRIEAGGLADEVALEQIGRELFVPGTTEPTGRIDDGIVTLIRDGTTLTGDIISRTEASGMIGPIEWRAKKDP